MPPRARPLHPPSRPGPRVLLIESDQSLARTLAHHLRLGGYRVDVTTVADAAALVGRRRPDLVVLDLVLSDGGGLSAFHRLREDGSMPVVMLSSRAQEADRIHGLNLGTDDFLPQPVSPAELVARVGSVLRRTRTDPGIEQAALRSARDDDLDRSLAVGSVVVDPRRHRCWVGERPVTLTGLELRLLAHFMRHPGEVRSREALLEQVWGFSVGATETVTVHVRRLREKIEPDPARPTLIETVWGVGYRFTAAVAANKDRLVTSG